MFNLTRNSLRNIKNLVSKPRLTPKILMLPHHQIHTSFSALYKLDGKITPTPPPKMRPPLILDGSINSELDPECDINNEASPRVVLTALLNNPNKIKNAHKKYLRAGANILTTANFSVSPFYLSRLNSSDLDPKYFPTMWPLNPNFSNSCDAYFGPTKKRHNQHIQKKPSPTLSSPPMLNIRTLKSVEQITTPPIPSEIPIATSPRPPSAIGPLAVCILPPNATDVYQTSRLECLPDTPLTRMFELVQLTAKLTREAIDEYKTEISSHSGSNPSNPSNFLSPEEYANHVISLCSDTFISAGCMGPLFGPDDVLLTKEYQNFENTGKPSPLLEVLWALAEYADGFTFTEGAITNAYDTDSSLQPPLRSISPCNPSTPSLKTQEELAASILRGIAMCLYSNSDVYLCESVSSIKQAEAVATAAMSTDKQVFVSFQLNNDDYGVPRLFSCETLAQAVDRLLHVLPRFVSGYGVNCSSPAIITAAIPLLTKITNKPIAAYARLPFMSCCEDDHEGHAHMRKHSPLIGRDNLLERMGKETQITMQASGLHPFTDSLSNSNFNSHSHCDTHNDKKSVIKEENTNIKEENTKNNPSFVGITLSQLQSLSLSNQTSPNKSNSSLSDCIEDDQARAKRLGDKVATIVSQVQQTPNFRLRSMDDDVPGVNHQCEPFSDERDYTTTSAPSGITNSGDGVEAARLVSEVLSASDQSSVSDKYAKLTVFWADKFGASSVGGCCNVGSYHVGQMRRDIDIRYKEKLIDWYKTHQQ